MPRLASYIALFALLLAIPGLAEPHDSDQLSGDSFTERTVRQVEEVLDLVGSLEPYRSALTPDQAALAMVRGLLVAYDDPYAAAQLVGPPGGRSAATISNDHSEFGILLDHDEFGRLVIHSVPGSTGLRPGDRVLRIGEHNSQALAPWDAMSRLVEQSSREADGSVSLTAERDGSAPFSVVLVPLDAPRRSVSIRIGEMGIVHFRETPEGSVAWIRLRSFAGDQTRDEWERVVNAVWEADDVRSVILDLRGNGGGENSLLTILGDFLPGGAPLVRFDALLVEEPWSQRVPNGFRPRSRLLSFPTAVLVDGGTASLGEIFAAALRDVRGFPLVGQRTYGKGTTQTWLEAGGIALHLTTAAWMSPAELSIDGVGLVPDVEIDPASPFATGRMIRAALRELDAWRAQ